MSNDKEVYKLPRSKDEVLKREHFYASMLTDLVQHKQATTNAQKPELFPPRAIETLTYYIGALDERLEEVEKINVLLEKHLREAENRIFQLESNNAELTSPPYDGT